jgi:hypothetical protein
MPNGAPQLRNATSEAESIEIELRPVLPVRKHSRDEPTLRSQGRFKESLEERATGDNVNFVVHVIFSS